MRISKSSFAAGAVAALVLGSGTAYAATGGNFILGKSNSAGATTVLTNSAGTALALNSKTGTAPLKVNSATKVTNLNADKIDGLDSTAFAKVAGQVGTIEGTGFYIDADDNQTPDFVAAIASCPLGTKVTGGGGIDGTPGGSLWYSSAQGSEWAVASSWTPVALPAEDTTTPRDQFFPTYPDVTNAVLSRAQCWNPKGTVPGAIFPRTAPVTPAGQLADLWSQRSQ